MILFKIAFTVIPIILRLPLSLKAALLACLTLAASAGAATYMADGVSASAPTSSDRFYDNGKGYYWDVSPVYDAAQQLYRESGNSFSFLGDLESRVKNPDMPIAQDSFDNMEDDWGGCWYNASSNMLQYWLSYYGVFCSDSSKLPYGYNYDKQNIAALGGTQSLKTGMYFYDYWQSKDSSGKPLGGDPDMAFNWFLKDGTNLYPGQQEWGYADLKKDGGGAFFENYYDAYTDAYVMEYFDWGSNLRKYAADYLMDAFGYNAQGEITTYGQLSSIGLASIGGGHALTCYGFSLDGNGLLESIYVTNSDDKHFTLFQLYVKEDNEGLLALYTDAAKQHRWDYAGYTWTICDMYRINTPEILQDMYAEYIASELTWTGEGGTWGADDAAKCDINVLPTASSGWTAKAKESNYFSYYAENRAVRFDDTASTGTVGLDGALTAPKVTIDNSAKAYTFTGTEGTTLSTPELVKSGTNTATFTGVEIAAEQLQVGTGALLLGQNATLEINGKVEVKALGSETAAGVFSTNGNQTYSLGNSSITIENAVVSYIANTAGTISNLLSNVKLVNNSTATLTENNSQNKSGMSAHAAKGSIQFLNKGVQGITLTDAIIGTNLSLSVYKGNVVSEAEETALFIQGKLVGLTNSTINADLTMMAGSELDVSGTENTGINLGSALTFNLGMKLSDADVDAVQGMRDGGVYHLFNSVDSITLASSDYTNWTQAITVEDAVDASTYFTNLEKGQYFITYTGGANVGQVMLMGAAVPEPATGTLSLLALSALVARRRRR